MNITDIPDRLRDLADSLEGDEWNHPLCSVEACLLGAAMAQEYLSQCERQRRTIRITQTQGIEVENELRKGEGR